MNRGISGDSRADGSTVSVQGVIGADFRVFHFVEVMIIILDDIAECVVVRFEARADCATPALVSDD